MASALVAVAREADVMALAGRACRRRGVVALTRSGARTALPLWRVGGGRRGTCSRAGLASLAGPIG